jgi:dipeptidyl aminopeptidase/acylaminoacyl peptidase
MFCFGQNIDSLYKKADSFWSRYATKYYYSISEIRPVGKSHSFWYRTQTPQGTEFFIIDGNKESVYPAFDQQRLADSLSSVNKNKTEAYKLSFSSLRFNDKLDSLFFNIGDDGYSCALDNYTIAKEKDREQRNQNRYWGRASKEDSKDRIKSPDGKKEAYISEGNLWITDLESRKGERLSEDGSPYEYYSSNIYWSPDSKKIVCCKYRPVDTRKLLLISSSPRDQLQPKTEDYDYPKPGDALPVRRPTVFLVDEKKSIPFNVPDVEAQYDLNRVRWDKDSNYFTFNFNKRGHQQYFVYAGDVSTGELRAVVKEESPTFVYYNNLYQHWMKDGNELLWISERDGWRHLYLYDTPTGKVKKQLTKGEWIVKSVVHVDEEKRMLIFKGCGMDKGEDPYLEKYYTLNIDNGKITPLTPENATHNVTFSSDYSCFVDNYSRVDMPPVVALRSAKDGKVITKPDNQPDTTEAEKTGWRMPEVFSAKGRDGETDIWGMIIRPSDFDPDKKYPVIEYIYAGPHDSHVPKSFGISYWPSGLAEMGFIAVLIDGMGTANRSKAFLDVCWKNLKDGGFPDRIAWMKAAAEKYPEMDISRVGIYGGSAGGQSSMGALLFHPDFYKVGVASCGCHDNRMDKMWWNEQWMGYPIGKEYEECSNVVNAKLLQGNLMLIVGELDNNVDPASTLQVADELIKHNKEFELVMLPGVRHTGGENYGERKRRDFFVKYLLGTDTPKWNEKEKK